MALPYVKQQRFWEAVATTTTTTLDPDFAMCPTKLIEIITAGFTGTIDFKGRVWGAETADNLVYLKDFAVGQSPSVAQLTFNGDTGRYRYIVAAFVPEFQIVMTCGGGTINGSAFGYAGLLTDLSVVQTVPATTAQQVTLAYGDPVVGTLPSLMADLLTESQRTNRLLEMLIDEEVSSSDV